MPSSSRVTIPTRLDNGRPSEIINEKENTDTNENKDDEKPDKFIDKIHEKHWEINLHKIKLIMKIERNDITKHIVDYNPEVSDEYVFKNPIIYDAREAGVREKIYNATGIPPNKLDITRITISTKRAKLAWVSFSSVKTVQDIFRLAMQNGSRNFNAFPHIPGKALKRH